MKFCRWIALAVMLSACEGVSPVSRSRTDNVEVTVEKLFTHEGCAVYRFHDDGRPHYYVVCDRGAAQASDDTRESTGKITSYHDANIVTVRR